MSLVVMWAFFTNGGVVFVEITATVRVIVSFISLSVGTPLIVIGMALRHGVNPLIRVLAVDCY